MAGSLNKVMVLGNLTRDPELKQTTNGQSVCTVGLATNRTWSNATGEKQEQVEYHNIVVWGKLAEITAQYLQKGRKAYFEGRLQTRDWEGQDGVRRYRTEIVAENMIMLDRSGAPMNGGGGSAPSAPSGENDYSQSAPQNADDDEIKIEDIPF